MAASVRLLVKASVLAASLQVAGSVRAASRSPGGAEAGEAAGWLAYLVPCCVLAAVLWRRGYIYGRPYSYPGDPVPVEQRLTREAKFRKGIKAKVEAGWEVVSERQPADKELLPGKVSGQAVWEFEPGAGAGAELVEEASQGFEPEENPNAGDRVFRALREKSWSGGVPDAAAPKPSDALEAARKGFAYYQTIQWDNGMWAGDYGGPHFLLPGFVITAYVIGKLNGVLPDPYWRAMLVYVRNHQQEDGGWGTHLESPSTVFGSVLNYTALRLLGVPADDAAAVEGRQFLAAHGGALYAPSWAKFWLALLGVYDWSGIAPVPPEMWLLPSWFPIHPGRFWCHCRMVYLPMCWLYSRRYTYKAEADPLTMALRKELFQGYDYDKIEWSRHMHSVAAIDNYSPIHWAMVLLQRLLELYEVYGPWNLLRKPATEFAEEYIHAEDIETNYLDIGPVSKPLNMLAMWVAAGGEKDPAAARKSKSFLAHQSRLTAYLWVAEDGMKVQGYNGSMTWDTSFCLQAVHESRLQAEFPEMTAKAWNFLRKEQVHILPHGDKRHWRQAINGGWGFSTAEQAWPVSDTTGEAFTALLLLKDHPCVAKSQPKVPDQHLLDGVEFLLSYQNADGGWATYESCRGWAWYEYMNPSEAFGDIMIDYSYVECSASSMEALHTFAKVVPKCDRAVLARIRGAVQRGKAFIKSIQRDDGSWYGCWGNSFTYGCWFGVKGLLVAGEDPQTCPEIQRCVRFLLGKQRADGGWGEDFASCFNREYADKEKLPGCDAGSTVVQTAWALLALMLGECGDAAAVKRGVDFLIGRQLPSGDWPQENIAGVFNRSVGITYTAFRNVFPLWALGRYAREYSFGHKLPDAGK